MDAFPEVAAVGLAGMSRSQSPAWMDEHLPPVFRSLKALGARLCLYKVCSSFDSASHVGSIGRALDIGARVFETASVPIIVGAPALRRYQMFGNLFATADQITYRIDRHPTMSEHPDPASVLDPASRSAAVESLVEACTRDLEAGRSVVACSAIGAPDAERAPAKEGPC